MSRQLDHIIHAGLLLILSAGIWKLAQQLPGKTAEQNNVEYSFVAEEQAAPAYSPAIAKGKTLFMGKCASCHNIYKATTGPALMNFTERGPWSDRKNVYAWVSNPSAFMKKNEYAANLKAQYGGQLMTAFPDLTHEEIDAICDYIDLSDRPKKDMPVY